MVEWMSAMAFLGEVEMGKLAMDPKFALRLLRECLIFCLPPLPQWNESV
jgi:hypothetical protein